MKKFAFVLGLLLAIGVAAVLILIGTGVLDLSTVAAKKEVNPETPQILETWEDINQFKAMLVNPNTFEVAAREQHPERFKNGVYPPVVAQLIPVPEQGEGAVKILITLPPGIVPEEKPEVVRFSKLEPNEIRHSKDFEDFARWIQEEYGKDPLWVNAQVVATKYFDGRIHTYRFSVRLKQDPSGSLELEVLQPSWWKEKKVEKEEVEETTFEPQTFASTEDIRLHHKGDMTLFMFAIEALEANGLVREDGSIPEVVTYQAADGRIGFKERYKNRVVGSNLEMYRFAKSAGVKNSNRVEYMLRSEGARHIKRDRKGAWLNHAKVQYDRFTGKLSVLGVVETEERDTLGSIGELIDFRLALKAKGVHFSPREMAARVREDLGLPQYKDIRPYFPLIVVSTIEPGTGLPDPHFSQGRFIEAVYSKEDLLMFADAMEYETAAFLERLAEWSGVDPVVYPYTSAPVYVIFDRTPDDIPVIAFQLIPVENRKSQPVDAGYDIEASLETEEFPFSSTVELAKVNYMQSHKDAVAAAFELYRSQNPKLPPNRLKVEKSSVAGKVELTFTFHHKKEESSEESETTETEGSQDVDNEKSGKTPKKFRGRYNR